jgi:DNA-binding IclR family transcriptional regulator
MPRESRSAKVAQTGTDDRRHIQSINVGFSIVRRLVEAPGSLSLRELADATGMPTSQVYLYLVSFMQVGYIVQEPSTNRYDLGPLALEAGLAVLRKTDVVDIAKPVLLDVQEQTGESVFLAVWGNRGPCIVSKVDGTRRSPMHLRVGYVQPLLVTATGRVFLAYLPAGETAELVGAEFASLAPNDALTPAELDKIIAKTRKSGLGISDNLRHDGFASLSAPILDNAGSIRAAMTVIRPVSHFEDLHTSDIERTLRAAAASLSHRLGYRIAS